jgi:hypothetical protein
MSGLRDSGQEAVRVGKAQGERADHPPAEQGAEAALEEAGRLDRQLY